MASAPVSGAVSLYKLIVRFVMAGLTLSALVMLVMLSQDGIDRIWPENQNPRLAASCSRMDSYLPHMS